MAGTFTATGTYSNLNRLELESLRLADDFAASKALTVGDSALPPEGVVGPGLSPNAEPFLSGPNVKLDDVYAITPPSQPGPGLGSLTQPATFVSETVKWFGPTYITDGTNGSASGPNTWSDVSGVNFSLAGVEPGDILLIKPATPVPESNSNFVATVVSVAPTVLTVDHIYGPGGITALNPESPIYTTSYLVVRPNAVQLFAVPASGATGFEQTFLAVLPGSTLHNTVAPTTDQINAQRVTDLVPSQYALNSTVDRADAVFDSPAPRLSLDLLGYRIVLYTDNGSGTGPNLSNPVTTLSPVIDPSIPSTDQRMTFDYKAGIVRFSCEPKLGGQIKVAGGTNPTTGRLNLYAVFWAVDTSLTEGAARLLYGVRSTNVKPATPGRIFFSSSYDAWVLGATSSTNPMFVRAPDPTDDARNTTYFGALDATSSNIPYRYLQYTQGANVWKFTSNDVAISNDNVASSYPVPYNEKRLGEALEYTVADIASPPFAGADFSPNATLNPSSNGRGTRNTTEALDAALAQAAIGDTGVVRLKRGRYQITGGVIYVPPGVVIEGDGDNTVIQVRTVTSPTNTTITPGFKFGPNTPWGVYDLTWNGTTVTPTVFDYTSTNVAQRLEGIACIWNSVRRCWGIAWADVNLNAVWFNEVNRDGTTTFPGFGINVKTTSNTIFSSLSPNSSNHTPGHYPRLAYQANSDQYAVVWVDQVTNGSSVVGPQCFINVFQVNPAITAASPGVPDGSQPLATVTYVNANAYAPVALTSSFSDHPSLAADNSSVSNSWGLFFTCWSYVYSSGTISGSGVTNAQIEVGFFPSILHSGGYGPASGTGASITLDSASGVTASITVTEGTVYVTGLSGILTSFVGANITISGAATPYNNGTFPIASFISAGAVTITNQLAANDANNGSIHWTISVPILTGLTGMIPSFVGTNITISNAATGANNGTFPIARYLSATSVTITNPSAATDANNGVIHWSVPLDYNVISSTDVDEDGAGNAYSVWVVRAHPLIQGSTGQFVLQGFNGPYLADASVSNWSNLGVIEGTKFCYLGSPGAYSYYYDATYGLPNTYFSASDETFDGILTPYGTDGTVYAFYDVAHLAIKPNFTGLNAYSIGAPYLKASGTATTGTTGTALVDSSATFITDGVKAGDMVLLTTPYPTAPNSGETMSIAAVVSQTQLTLSEGPIMNVGNTFNIYYGQPFNYALVPPSQVQGQLFNASVPGYVQPVTTFAGNIVPDPAYYTVEPVEPDYVRIRRGGNNWLIVYQAMETTAYFAHEMESNWNDSWGFPFDTAQQVTWNGATFIDFELFLRVTGWPYRKHISTCVVLLSANGLPLNTNYGAQLQYVNDSVISRDINISNRSLGAVVDPLTYRPNYTQGFDSGFTNIELGAYPLYRQGYNLALQVSPLCWIQKWTSTSAAGLIPDVTWTGEDWVVVSPTKKDIHGYAGNYFVDGSGNAYLGDAMFYFGLGGPNNVDLNYLRQTVEVGDYIYFPAINKYATIASIHSEHTVVFTQVDGTLFNYGHNAFVPFIEWVLVRANSTGIRPAGMKNLGYRVSANGQVIVSSSYNTFADELPDNSWIANNVPDRTALMTRSNSDLTFYWLNLATDGHNLPGNINDDIMDPEARYMGDVGFRGVAPGAPHGCNDQSNESPMVAIAWGENFYGFFEHVIEGSTTADTATNQVRFYRQSFGPYHSGMRNLKLYGYNQPPLNTSLTTLGSELKTLTQQLVYTRHGSPVEGQGFFATDGFRCFFPIASFRGLWSYNFYYGVPYYAPYGGGTQPCLQGFYTDAIGRYPIQVQGPEVQNKPYVGNIYPNANDYRGDFGFGYTQTQVSQQPSAPRVVWNGEHFVVVWFEGGFAGYGTSPLLCMTTFPGSEDAGLQGPELVNTNDFQIMRRPTHIAIVEPRNFGEITVDSPIASSAFVTCDVAFSGRVYAVLWTAGLDLGAVPNYGGNAAIVGVTLLDNTGAGSTFFDYDPKPFYSSGTGIWTSGPPAFFWDNTFASEGAFANGSEPVQPGDILIVTYGPNTGKYLVYSSPLTYDVNFLKLDIYPPMPVAETNISYTIHHPLSAGGAVSYVLGAIGNQTYSYRDAYVSPCITWDGHQFLCVWRGRVFADFPLANGAQGPEQNIQYVQVPETGLAHGQLVKRTAGYGQATGSALDAHRNNFRGIGVAQNGQSNPNVVFMVSAQFYASGTFGDTSGNTLTDSGGEFLGIGVAPGDLVTISTGASQYAQATITEVVSNTEVTVSGDYNPGLVGFTSGSAFITGTNQHYFFSRRIPITAHRGDMLRVTNLLYYNGSSTLNYSDSLGDYYIQDVDYYNNVLVLSVGGFNEGGLHTSVGFVAPGLYGSVLGGGFSNLNVNAVPDIPYGDYFTSTIPYGSPYLGIGNDISFNPRAIGVSLLYQGQSTLGLNPDYIFKLVYNEVTDEYAILYASNGSVAIGTFDRSSFQLKKETIVYNVTIWGFNAKCADMAWNGSRYLVVVGAGGFPYSSAVPTPLQYAVVTTNLQIEDQGQSNTSSGNLGVQTLYNLTGNTPGTVPGPTYAPPDLIDYVMAPQWKNCQVRWNPRLNRWVVSASSVWLNSTDYPITKTDMYFSGGLVPYTLEYANEYWLQNSTIQFIGSNQIYIEVPFGFVDYQYLQSGLKLAWLDPGSQAWAGMSSILSVLFGGTDGGGNTYWLITVSTVTFPPNLDGSTATLFVLPREDCFVWTLGYDTPAVAFEDADTCFLQNVTFAGGTADIEERYKRMARPTWQSGGAPIGQINSGTSIVGQVQRPSQYNHLLLTPTMKVEVPKFMGVKSYAKYRNGTGFTPGNPVFDRYEASRRRG